MNALVPDLDDLLHRDVEEVAVVGDQDESIGVGGEIFLQPVTSFEIKVIGGLVEQQQIGFLQQELGERDAHLPAAGEFVGFARPIFFAESQAGQHGADLGFDGVTVAGLEFVFDAMIAVGDLRVLG